MSKQQTAADLRAAAAYIDQHGWQQGMAIYHETGAVCALGALGMVCEGDADLAYSSAIFSDGRFGLAAQTLRNHLIGRGLTFTSVPAWNDRRDRVQADVTEALEKAAAWVEEQA